VIAFSVGGWGDSRLQECLDRTRYPSPMTDVFLHNPRCSTSRAALELVRDAGVELPVREYLDDPLSLGELRRIVQLLGVRPIDIVRRGEPQCAALELSTAPRRRVSVRIRRA